MEVHKTIFYIILGCSIVTWIPRVLPFIVSKKLTFPKRLNDFLSFIPLCILTALFVQGMFVVKEGQWASLNIENALASLPTFLVAIFTRNLMFTVIVGIVTMALLRFVL